MYVYVYIYIYICYVCTYMCIYIYICIYLWGGAFGDRFRFSVGVTWTSEATRYMHIYIYITYN